MQHLVVEKIFDRIAWTRRPVEDFAYDDRVVGRVVMSQQSPRVALAPCQFRPAEQPSEEPHIQRVENFLKVVVAPFRSGVAFAPARGPNQLGLLCDCGARSETL